MNRLLIILLCAFANPVFASCLLQADTTNNNFAIGPFVDPSTGDAETGLTVADGDILWKQPDSTTFAEETGFSDCTHRAAGMYTCPYDNTVVDTEGLVEYVVDVAGALTVWGRCMVVGSDYFDLLDGTTSLMTSTQAGNALQTTIDGVTSQTQLSMAAGPTNDDAYNNMTAYIKGGTDECERQITDYTATGNNIVIASACDFTVATSDVIYVMVGPAGAALEEHDVALAATDNVVDAILVDTGTTLDGKIDTIDGKIDGLVPVDTTIATLASQVSFTLTAGSADDDAYNGCMAMVTDQSTATQIAFAGVQDYTGSSKTVTLDADPGIFTMATGDLVTVSCLGVTVEFMNKSEVLGDGSSGDKWRGN